jgi:hypothetical protein
MEFDEDDPRYQVRILAMRLDTLGKEKEHIEVELREERAERKKLDERVSAMEKSFQRGFGMLVIIPVLGTVAGLISAYGKVIFAPWLTKS